MATYTANLTSLYTQPAEDPIESIYDLPPGTVVCTRGDMLKEGSVYYVPNLASTYLAAASNILFLETSGFSCQDINEAGFSCVSTADTGNTYKMLLDGMTAEQAEALGCNALLDFVPSATVSVNNDIHCRAYIGWRSDSLLSYPTVLFHSPATDQRVVKALDALISGLRTDGFIERAYKHSVARKVPCPNDGFTAISLQSYFGMFLFILLPAYMIAMALHCTNLLKKRKKAPKLQPDGVAA